MLPKAVKSDKISFMSEGQTVQSGGAKSMPSYEEMIKAGVHYGRKKTVLHPNMKPFIYSLKETIHILDVLKTEEKTREAIEFLKKTKDEAGVILWVASTPQSQEKIIEIGHKLNMPYVANRWVGGLLTNFKTLSSRVKYMIDLEDKLNNPEVTKEMIKKERVKLEKELKKLKIKFDGIRSMEKLPQAVFITSLRESKLAVREAKRLGIKTVSIVNTESNPALVDFPIPANDNAKQSVNLILDTIIKNI